MPIPYKETPAYKANLERIYLNPHKRLPLLPVFYHQCVANLALIMMETSDNDLANEAARRIDFIESNFLKTEGHDHVRIVAQN